MSSEADVFFRRLRRRLFSLLPDILYLPKYFVLFFFAADMRCNYMILNPITFKPYYLNLIPITNVSTGTHNYNTQTYNCDTLSWCFTYTRKHKLLDSYSTGLVHMLGQHFNRWTSIETTFVQEFFLGIMCRERHPVVTYVRYFLV